MRVDDITFTDQDGTRPTVTVSWDIVITRLSGNRWRVLFPVSSIIYKKTGKSIKGDLLKTFVRLKSAAFHTAFDVRQGFISTDPIRISQIEGNLVSVKKEVFSNQVAVFFEAFTTDKSPKGVLQATDTEIDSKDPLRLIASEDVRC